MFNFYSKSDDRRFSVSPTYLEDLCDQFRVDQASGLLEVQTAPDQQNVLLYEQGKLAAAYRLTLNCSTLLSRDEVGANWEIAEAPTRMLNLPSFAIRVLWMALEWHPPERQQSVEARYFNALLESSKDQQRNALLRVTTSKVDGFLLFWNGNLKSGECAFCDGAGFQNNPHFTFQPLDASTEVWHITHYIPTQSSFSYHYLTLRLGLIDWINGALAAYQRMVGKSLLLGLNFDLNTQAARNRWDICMVGASVIDRHLFLEMNSAVQVYWALLHPMNSTMAQVIGNRLAQHIIEEAFQGLITQDQQALQAQSLSPAIIS